MRIVAPLSEPSEVEALVQAGAGELYGGVYDRGAVTGPLSEGLNRRQGVMANFDGYEELAEAVRRAHRAGATFSLTLNAHMGAPEAAAALAQARVAARIGVDRLIVADAGFVALLRREGLGLPIKMSTGAAVFSAATLRFFRGLGADGFVLPRHLSVAEVLAIRRDTRGEADLEVFLMNTRCPYEDGLCGFSHYIPQGAVDRALHSPAMPAKVGRLVRELPLVAEIAPQRRRFGCGMEYDFEDGEEDAELARRAADRGTETPVEADLLHLLSACGACAVWDLARGGVDAAKVVGRALPLRRKLRDVGIVREAIRLALAVEDRREFAAEMRDRFAKARGRPCTRADCYYPEQDNGHGKA